MVTSVGHMTLIINFVVFIWELSRTCHPAIRSSPKVLPSIQFFFFFFCGTCWNCWNTDFHFVHCAQFISACLASTLVSVSIGFPECPFINPKQGRWTLLGIQLLFINIRGESDSITGREFPGRNSVMLLIFLVYWGACGLSLYNYGIIFTADVLHSICCQTAL